MRHFAYRLLVAGTAVSLAAPVAAGQVKQPYGHSHAVVMKGHSAPAQARYQRHRHTVGHRFDRRNVVVVRDWERRGLRHPGKDEAYIIDGDDLYLVAASSLIVKALID